MAIACVMLPFLQMMLNKLLDNVFTYHDYLLSVILSLPSYVSYFDNNLIMLASLKNYVFFGTKTNVHLGLLSNINSGCLFADLYITWLKF